MGAGRLLAAAVALIKIALTTAGGASGSDGGFISVSASMYRRLRVSVSAAADQAMDRSLEPKAGEQARVSTAGSAPTSITADNQTVKTLGDAEDCVDVSEQCWMDQDCCSARCDPDLLCAVALD